MLVALAIVSTLLPAPPGAARTLTGPSEQTVVAAAARSHDWRAPGYVAAVDGQLFDPWCVPLRSVGSNVPNLPFRAGLDQNLEWMRAHQMRWMRVFATGHALGPDRAPSDAATAIARLRALLDRVAAYNAAHHPAEAIYVLVALTDYYPPGVPGDRHAFDHPFFRDAPVLPAPWFRAGVPRFDFDQEHDLGRVYDLPNYEVYYKPWVRQIVASLADHPALLGWQLGNELKARGSGRNGISSAQAYEWYLAFMRDVTDTIRSLDSNHLIVAGTQYLAELTDWGYRPNGGLDLSLVPTYRDIARRFLDACGESCWNVMSLTGYDFNPYPLDDAALTGQAGVATLMTEYGFTRGTAEEMQQRFGGDRVAAVRFGLDRAWLDLEGRLQPRHWGAVELVERAPLAGLAPWGSPAPGPDAGLDADSRRGITFTPDEQGLWDAFREVAARLEAANRAAGPSAACRALDSRAAPPPPVPHDERYFFETGYRIDDEAIWQYFTARGGLDLFGFPVSRTFLFLGCPVQVFQRQIAQHCPGRGVQLINLLDPEIFPYTRVNFSTFPPPDQAVKAATPKVGEPDYDTRIIAFVRAVVPDVWEGQRVNFQQTFFGLITPEQAGTNDPGLLALLNLEVWGAPISYPARDPNNASFVYQRFQRGIMHYDAVNQVTRGILLADYLKQVLRNSAELPPDLREQAAGSRYFAQYCPGEPGWLCRPDELPGTHLTFAFEEG